MTDHEENFTEELADSNAISLEIANLIELQGQDITQILTRVEGLENQTVPLKYCWREIEDQTHALNLWRTLREWVDWLNVRYFSTGIFQILPCWYRHSAAVEELTALWAAWMSVYHGNGYSQEAAYWHDRLLWPCVERLKGYLRDCKLSEHHEASQSAVSTAAGFEEFIVADTQNLF